MVFPRGNAPIFTAALVLAHQLTAGLKTCGKIKFCLAFAGR
jgi:hypothetical protein